METGGESGEQSIEARYEGESIWLTQKLMAELFGVDVRTISEHLANIYTSQELIRKATIRKFRTVQREGSRNVTCTIEHYSLDGVDYGDYLEQLTYRIFLQMVVSSFAKKRIQSVWDSHTLPARPLPTLGFED